jgi:hypothetical protein
MFLQISSRIRLPRNSRDLLHAADLRHRTGGFTSPPKGGVLRIFSPLKIRRLRPGLNARTWVPKASTLPLDHRSRPWVLYVNKQEFYASSWRSTKVRRILVSVRVPSHFKRSLRCKSERNSVVRDGGGGAIHETYFRGLSIVAVIVWWRLLL